MLSSQQWYQLCVCLSVHLVSMTSSLKIARDCIEAAIDWLVNDCTLFSCHWRWLEDQSCFTGGLYVRFGPFAYNNSHQH